MPLLATIAFFVLGAVCASFVGVVSERAYTGQSWKKGRSRCNSCREELSAHDLVPVLSWLVHRGRCRQCGARVPGLYALYEVVLGALFALSYWVYGLGVPLIFFLVSLCLLAFIVIYDLRHTIVPMPASSAFIVSSALFFAVAYPGLYFIGFAYAAGIALFFFLLYVCSRGRAMGLGDTPVSFGMALLAGKAAIAGLFFSFWIGGVIGIFILVFRKGGPRMGIEVPFVPFMAAGFLLALFTQWNPLPF